ncbi:MAG: hypothetical protein EOP04_16385, partial [Proteobacteria bacterium]
MLLIRTASLTLLLSSFSFACGGSSGGSKGGGAAASRATTIGANLAGVAAIGNKTTSLGLTEDSSSTVVAMDAWGKALSQALVTADDGSGDKFIIGQAQVLKDGSISFSAFFNRKTAVPLEKDVVLTLPNGKEYWKDCRGKLRVFPAKNNEISCLAELKADPLDIHAIDFIPMSVVSDKLGNVYLNHGSYLMRYSTDGSSTKIYEGQMSNFVVTDDGMIYMQDIGILISPSGTKTSVSGDFVAAIDSKIILKSSDSAFKGYDTSLTVTEIEIDPQLGLEGSLDTKVADGKIVLISNGHTVTIDLTAKTLQAEQIVNAGLDAALFAGQGLFYISEQGLFYRQLSPQALHLTDAGSGNVALLEGVVVKSIT